MKINRILISITVLLILGNADCKGRSESSNYLIIKKSARMKTDAHRGKYIMTVPAGAKVTVVAELGGRASRNGVLGRYIEIRYRNKNWGCMYPLSKSH